MNTWREGRRPNSIRKKLIYTSALNTTESLFEMCIRDSCKHFPGHGDTEVDSHKALPVVNFDRARLDSIELFPFKEAVKAGLGGMMVGHL